MRRLAFTVLPLAILTIAFTGCGSQEISVSKGDKYYEGAKLFADHCSGCHSLDAVGAQGSADNVRNKELTDGPNFNVRAETATNVLYAIENGGFSGKIMPQNIVTGADAKAVAAFVAKYAGQDVAKVPSLQPDTAGGTATEPVNP
jgi:mono/diheme cytochrome c family protein